VTNIWGCLRVAKHGAQGLESAQEARDRVLCNFFAVNEGQERILAPFSETIPAVTSCGRRGIVIKIIDTCAISKIRAWRSTHQWKLFMSPPAGPTVQGHWRWCNKCQGLFFPFSNDPGPCPAGGQHNPAGSDNYVLRFTTGAAQPGQSNWRWCTKCNGLAFAGNPSLGSCPAGGLHEHTGSFDYVLLLASDPAEQMQSNWRWCTRCQGLAFAGSPSLGPCPAGGLHDHTGSDNYFLDEHGVAPPPPRVQPQPMVWADQNISGTSAVIHGSGFPSENCSVTITSGAGFLPTGPWTGNITKGIPIEGPCSGNLSQSYVIQVTCPGAQPVSLTINCPP
jgi:hypothetical protein